MNDPTQIKDTGIAETLEQIRRRKEQAMIAAGLPDWPENKRGLPNGASWSTQFGTHRWLHARNPKV